MVHTPKKRRQLKLNFNIYSNFHLMSPNLNALDLISMKTKSTQRFSWKAPEVEKPIMKKSISFNNVTKQTTKSQPVPIQT